MTRGYNLFIYFHMEQEVYNVDGSWPKSLSNQIVVVFYKCYQLDLQVLKIKLLPHFPFVRHQSNESGTLIFRQTPSTINFIKETHDILQNNIPQQLKETNRNPSRAVAHSPPRFLITSLPPKKKLPLPPQRRGCPITEQPLGKENQSCISSLMRLYLQHLTFRLCFFMLLDQLTVQLTTQQNKGWIELFIGRCFYNFWFSQVCLLYTFVVLTLLFFNTILVTTKKKNVYISYAEELWRIFLLKFTIIKKILFQLTWRFFFYTSF